MSLSMDETSYHHERSDPTLWTLPHCEQYLGKHRCCKNSPFWDETSLGGPYYCRSIHQPDGLYGYRFGRTEEDGSEVWSATAQHQIKLRAARTVCAAIMTMECP